MAIDRNKQITRATYEGVWHDHRLELIDELFTPDVILHVNGQVKSGRDNLLITVRDIWLASFPDLGARVDIQVAEDDLVCDWVTFSGSHSGVAFHGIEPSGAMFSFTQMTISRLEDSKVAEVWEDFDWAGLLRQLGVTFLAPGEKAP